MIITRRQAAVLLPATIELDAVEVIQLQAALKDYMFAYLGTGKEHDKAGFALLRDIQLRLLHT